ncbi:MAG: hypothetical protein KAJ51_05570, partial [Thermoplasmata archaeon]|nr:hypothetical protein [Thermoplasmata archaeon]
MRQRYIELDDISHLNQVYNSHGKGKGNGSVILNDRLWRESYYFNMRDGRTGLGLISTIGILPNQKKVTGFFLLIKGDRVIALKPLIEFKKPIFNDCAFSVKGLEYIIEGTNWRLQYNSPKLSFNIRFSPINKIYSYITKPSDLVFSRIGTQHLEQFGTFKGKVRLMNKKITFGPCFGHRDHSWGIRDWASVDYYRLFCCAFSKEFAFNLWEGKINGSEFLKGYIFDRDRNVKIARCAIKTGPSQNRRSPESTIIKISDKENRDYKIKIR